jgi:FHA domain-containing protein
MSPAEEPEAWSERQGQEYVLQGNCSIGRAALNTLVLESPKVSRLHAIIHSERPSALWLLDLGCDSCLDLRPGDEAQFVRLHQAGMRGHDAHAEAVGAAFGCGHVALVNVGAVAIGLAVLS